MKNIAYVSLELRIKLIPQFLMSVLDATISSVLFPCVLVVGIEKGSCSELHSYADEACR
jgi:hypothetical protein